MKKISSIAAILFVTFTSAQLYTAGGTVGSSSTGNVGIGISNPESKLDIGTNNTQKTFLNYQNKSSITFIPNAGSWFHISHGLNNDLAISQGASVDQDRLVTIKNSGYVGIGKSEPQARLDVLGNIKVGDDDHFFAYNGADIRLKATSRDNFGEARALVNEKDNILTINFLGDFTGGTKIGDNVAFFKNNGNVSIREKLEAREVLVTQTPTADFVFEENYGLPKLEDVEKHIKQKKHLPEIASAKEMEKEGVNVGEFQIKLLQKIEELTLYSIEQNKKIKFLESENQQFKTLLQRVEKLEQKSVNPQ